MFHNNIRIYCLIAVCFAVLLAGGCASINEPSPPVSQPTRPARSGQLTPFASPTATASPSPTNPASPTPLPSPTPTLRTHIIKKGDDLGGIAWQYRVSLEDLMTANPTVQPYLLRIGDELVIPPATTPEPPPAGTTPEPPTPTPMPVETGRLNCAEEEDGGVWCFLPVHNSGPAPLESLSALIRLADAEAVTILPQEAFPPLDVLPPGESMPLLAYFPPSQSSQLSRPFQASAEILTALPSPDDGRYLPAAVEDQRVIIAADGLSAAVEANIVLTSPGTAQRIWAAAVAYDAGGNITGVRKWESPAEKTLKSGQKLPVQLQIYSVSAPIERVEILVQARP